MATKTLNVYTQEITERLLLLMAAKGMNRSDLAEALDLTNSTVSTAMSGTNNWGFQTILKMAEIFNVSLDYLILGKEKNAKETELRKQLEAALKENAVLKEKLELFEKMQQLMKKAQ